MAGAMNDHPGTSDGATQSGEPSGEGGLLAASARRWESTLEVSLRAALVPYGYTITVWASGAYLIHLQGAPALLEAFGFVSGAIIAFALLATISGRLSPSPEARASDPQPDPSHPIFAAGLHILAVGMALGAASLADSLLGNVAWLVSSFLATAVYLSLASAELAFAIELKARGFRLRRPRRAPLGGGAPTMTPPSGPIHSLQGGEMPEPAPGKETR